MTKKLSYKSYYKSRMFNKKLFLGLYLGCVISNIHAMFTITSKERKMASLYDVCAKIVLEQLFLTAKQQTKQQYNKNDKNIRGYNARWKKDKRDAQVKSLIAFFAQDILPTTVLSTLLDWFIKNPESPLFCMRSWKSTVYIANALFSHKNIYLKYSNIPLLESIIKSMSKRMEKTVHPDFTYSDEPTTTDLKQKLINYMDYGTNPTRALIANIDPSNDEATELIDFLFQYNCWIKNNKDVWEMLTKKIEKDPEEEYYKKLLICIFKQPLSLSLKKYILYFIAAYSYSSELNKIILNNMYFDKNLISCCFPLHKAIKNYNNTSLEILCKTNKFDINSRYKNKTPVNLLVSRVKNISEHVEHKEVCMLQSLQTAGAYFDNNDLEKIKNILDYTKERKNKLTLENLLYHRLYDSTIVKLERILAIYKNQQDSLNI